ncbi:ABC-type sugar transport system, permease component [Longilinea arvoryzae]|uniref:ABC-type sugar transport system, permease component n=1 Tax=Longilinea arvoryzae TaxID=360412 RepID=A0A0S7BCE9_9CHLR|nr:carbohydrate ABC transporter permease [Longilinea arvoryzae]GAP12857.1 ABC-type sugar transport system, permease component [Longilinea arvoryzae]
MEAAHTRTQSNSLQKRIVILLSVTILTIGAITMILPFVWSLLTSLKSSENVFAHSAFWIQFPPDFSAYKQIWQKVPILTYTLNTLKVSLIVTVGQLLTSSLAGYAFAKLKFPGRDKLFVFYLATMMIPGTVLLIPNFVIMSKIGAVNTHWALILSAVGSVYSTFLMRQFFQSFPSELMDAAKLDGCNPFGFYWNILLPNSKPIFTTLGLMAFQGIWNDFQWPLIVLNDQKLRTLQVGLSYLNSEFYTDWNLLMAGSILTMLPILILFFCVQKYFVQSFKLTGLKG